MIKKAYSTHLNNSSERRSIDDADIVTASNNLRNCLLPGLNSLQCIGGEIGTKSKSMRKRSQEIDRVLTELGKKEKETVKILLLGSGESGKSTLVKQMKIIHNDGFSKEELLSFKPTVRDNLVRSMKYALLGMSLLKIRLADTKNKKYIEMVLSYDQDYDDDCFVLDSKIGFALRNLWNDKGVRLATARGYEYELNDSALYFFENMERICKEKYVPTAMDVLRARIRTTGVIETQFRVNDITFRLVDVGGQRSERRKWIQCFDDVRAVLFVAALSGYDMLVNEHYNNENGSKNNSKKCSRLNESLYLFKDICNNKYFTNTSTLLFLNKLDLFREKILNSERHLRLYLPDYKYGDNDVDNGAIFIQNKFEKMNKNKSKTIFTHFTTATDTSNVQVVFQTVMETIVRENIKKATFL